MSFTHIHTCAYVTKFVIFQHCFYCYFRQLSSLNLCLSKTKYLRKRGCIIIMCNISVNATTWTVTIFLNYSPSDINRRINKYYQDTIDQQTHTLAQLIFELVMVRDGEWSLSDSNFTKDDISAAIEHLCRPTMWCPATVLVCYCLCWCIILVVLSFYLFFCFFLFFFTFMCFVYEVNTK